MALIGFGVLQNFMLTLHTEIFIQMETTINTYYNINLDYIKIMLWTVLSKKSNKLPFLNGLGRLDADRKIQFLSNESDMTLQKNRNSGI